MLLGLYFLIVIALPLALGSYVMYNGLPRTRRCPTCADETLRLQSGIHELGSRLLKRTLHLRWCLSCGWHGTAQLGHTAVARHGRSTAVAPAAGAGPGSGPGAAAERGAAAAEPDRVDLRTLHVDGDRWRVMVECWAEDGRWLARLVFVAPGGQVCADKGSMEGESVLEVISQAFSLPEQTLAGRLRRSIR